MNKKSPSPKISSGITRSLLIIITVLIAVLILGTGFFLGSKHTTVQSLTPTVFPQTATTSAPSMTAVSSTPPVRFISSGPNPASAFCSQQGGKLSIETRGDGGQYGLCTFEMGYACEEWAMFRGECPVGGVRTTGFDTVDQKYCAWSGGSTLAVEKATCTFSNGNVCEDTAYYNGTCSK